MILKMLSLAYSENDEHNQVWKLLEKNRSTDVFQFVVFDKIVR